MKTKINIAIMIVVASVSLIACNEEEIKVGPPTPQPAAGIENVRTPIK